MHACMNACTSSSGASALEHNGRNLIKLWWLMLQFMQRMCCLGFEVRGVKVSVFMRSNICMSFAADGGCSGIYVEAWFLEV